MIIKKLVTIFLTLFILSSCDEGSAGKSANLPVVFESTINLIVDGTPVELSKRFKCKIEQFSKAGGDKWSEISQTGNVVSYKLPTGEYIIASVPYSCNRFGAVKDENGKIINYKITRPISDDFLPYVSIADKGPVPDKVIVYASNLAYKAKASRIEFKGITLDVAPKGSKPSKIDKFYWFLSYGGGSGPYYHSFILRKAVMIPELRVLLDKHLSDAIEPVMFHNGKWNLDHKWFGIFYNGTKLPNERRWVNINSEKIFPESHGHAYEKLNRGNSLANSAYNSGYLSSFQFKEKINFSGETLELFLDEDYSGMLVFYRVPYKDASHYSVLYKIKNLKYNLPNGGIYYHHKGDNISHILYNPSDKEVYVTRYTRNFAAPVKGWFMGKYNK